MELRNRILQRRWSPSKAAAPAHTYDITPQPRRPQIEFAQLINSPLLTAAAAAAVPWPSRPSPTTVALLSAAVAVAAAAAALALGRPPSAVALLLELIVMKL